MILFLEENTYIDTAKGLDLSLPLTADLHNPRAWYVQPPKFEPVRSNGFTGVVAEGGSVNFRNIFFNPHGHGTHTECLGHITEEVYSVNEHLKQAFFKAKLITISPEKVWNEEDKADDEVITRKQLKNALKGVQTEALVIRTTPNTNEKKSRNYSDSNPPYIDASAIEFLNEAGIMHLLIDLPSVDREEDGGVLAFHHAFWGVPDNPQFHKTITEFIFVENSIPDGNYILNLQTAPFENDATPSRPVLFEIFSK